jgi:hypothetical protein
MAGKGAIQVDGELGERTPGPSLLRRKNASPLHSHLATGKSHGRDVALRFVERGNNLSVKVRKDIALETAMKVSSAIFCPLNRSKF